MIGAYSIKYSTFDLFVAIGIGALGVAMRRFGYPITPLILGAILGPMAETQFRRSMQLSQGDGSIFISTPVTWVMYSLIVVALSWPWIWKFVKPMISEKENKAKTSKAK
jgi:putative tricarboxylic transport membrane protein